MPITWMIFAVSHNIHVNCEVDFLTLAGDFESIPIGLVDDSSGSKSNQAVFQSNYWPEYETFYI